MYLEAAATEETPNKTIDENGRFNSRLLITDPTIKFSKSIYKAFRVLNSMEKFKHLEPNFSGSFEGLFNYVSKKYKHLHSSMNKTINMAHIMNRNSNGNTVYLMY